MSNRIWTAIGLTLLMTGSTAQTDDFALQHNAVVPAEYTAMEVGVMNLEKNKMETEKFFEGPLPEIGQCVEYMYVGKAHNGDLRFSVPHQENVRTNSHRIHHKKEQGRSRSAGGPSHKGGTPKGDML